MSQPRRGDACVIQSPGRRRAAAPADRAQSTLRTLRFRRLALEGVWGTAARTEVHPDFSTSNGTIIQQYQLNGGMNQRWGLFT
jgi:hypothetical protein